MDYRSPLQHLLHSLLPSRSRPDTAIRHDFADTQPVDEHAAAVQAARHQTEREHRWSAGWTESAIELAVGTEIMEYPEDAAADLMDQFFDMAHKRAA